VIVREKPGSYLLIKQHDHGLISGEFARHWAEEPRPLKPTLYAIANHDAGWQGLDAFVRWNEESGKPYSFADYPIEPKLRAYEKCLDFLEARDPYAAYLCSMHYGWFVRGSEHEAEVRFRESEAGRRRRIKSALSGEELNNLERNFRFLQLCDNLSLFVCLNEPGRNTHPWYKNGFSFEGTKFEPVWENRRVLRLEPNPFSEPFDLVVPYTLVEKGGRTLGSNRLELRVTC
jgi:hypothetical protein